MVGVSAIPFSQFMAWALYGDDGFYSQRGGAGRRRDFVTSVEIGTLFGAIVAARLDVIWVDLGQPTEFWVYDVGAGPGTLARTVKQARPECASALRYVSVDVSERMRALHLVGEGFSSTDSLPTATFTGVVMAHELLDNLPTEIAEYRDGAWWQVWVDETYTEVLRRPDEAVARSCQLVSDPIEGGRIPVPVLAQQWVERVLELLEAGALIVVDYGRPTTAELLQEAPADFLRTYRDHQRTHDPYIAPGHTDITIDIPFDQLAAVRQPDSLMRQRDALIAWGLDSILEQSQMRAGSLEPGSIEMLMAKSHATEARSLTDQDGLGAFWVAEWLVSRQAPDPV